MMKQILILAAAACVLGGCYSSDTEKNKATAERKLHSAKSPVAKMARVDTLVVKNSSVLGTVGDPAGKYVIEVTAARYEYPDPKTKQLTNYLATLVAWVNQPDARVDLTVGELPPLLEALDKMIGASGAPAGFQERKQTYKTNGGLFVTSTKGPAGHSVVISFEGTSLATNADALKQLKTLLVQAQQKLLPF